MIMGKKLIIVSIVALLAVAGAVYRMSDAGDYKVTIVMPSAAQLAKGSPVWVDGVDAGRVTDLQVRDGKAVVEAVIASEHAPLRDGTTSRVEWKSALGERILTLYPGPAENPTLPDGAILEAQSRQVEVDQVLAALDAPTRKRLASLLGELDGMMEGSERDVRATLKTAGPALDALGHILAAVGRDGPAIRSMVKELSQMTAGLAARRADVAGTVDNLTTVTDQVARREAALSASLKELPNTLTAARQTLDRLPGAVDATAPLLDDLRPSTARLRSVAENLGPVLRTATPTLRDLTPLLRSTNGLLDRSPAMLTTAGDVLPPAATALQAYQPAFSFLRPYTPEFVGWLGNWGQNFAPYDSQGHVWSATLAPGTNAFNESLVRPPGAATSSKPLPGEVVGQPWTDAHGSEMQ